MEKLKLPKKERPIGLFLFCNNCHKQYKYDGLVKCKCDKLVYLSRIHISGTKNNEIKTILKSKNFEDAILEFMSLKNKLIKNSYQKIEIRKIEQKPELLVECFAYYMGYLNNVDVPKHKVKIRTSMYISTIENRFKYFKEALDANNLNVNALKFTDITDEMIGFLHDYLLNVKKYSNKTYNNTMADLSGFTSHIINKFKFEYTNPFQGVEKLHENPKKHSLHEDEFNNLINIIKPENGIDKYYRPHRKSFSTLNRYKDWLVNGIYLGLFTGGRSEEIVKLKWSQIQLNEKGEFDRFVIIHYKIEKSNSHLVSEKDRITKDVIITKELGDFLTRIGYNNFKDSDEYILAPERENRIQVGSELSRGFTFFYGKLNTGKEISFKNLRKTYITSAVNQYGAGAIALSEHATLGIVQKHYYDNEIIKEEAKSTFQVFKPKK